MRILYVEDNLLDADLTIRRLGVLAPSFELEVLPTMESALVRLDHADQRPLDLVLTDMHLSDGDGLSLLRHVRERSIPVAVVVITGLGDEETAVAALKARADDYVVKKTGYLDRLPGTLVSALTHFRSESRRARTINVLYAESNVADLDSLVQHFGIHANHIKLQPTSNAAEALYFLKNPNPDRVPDVLLLDFELPGLDALELLRELRATLRNDIPVVIVCSYENEVLARQSLNRGANSVIVRRPGYLYQLPWELEDAHSWVELQRSETALRASEDSLKTALTELRELKDRIQEENIYLQKEVLASGSFGEIIGQSESLMRVLQSAEQVAPLDTTVLILGETGTGKELMAHALHSGSPRKKQALVRVNCATLPADLIESELFGHEKGAFTGANARRSGRFEIANNGTIFLDEVGELALDLQTKLLRVLQEGEFEPVGSSRTVKVDVRVIAATNRNLEEAVSKGTFRSDLYYRLNIFPITVPPLRERKSDIPMLVRHFVKELSHKFNKPIDSVSHDTMNALKNYPWPGNIRELRNVIERAVITTQGATLTLAGLPSISPQETSKPNEPEEFLILANGVETLEESQHNLILQALKNSYWRVEGPYGAAAALKIHPSKLRSMMKKLGITRPKVQLQ